MAKFLPIPSSHSAASLVHVGGRPLDRRWVWEFVRVSECEERHSSSRTKVVRPSQTALQSRQLSRLVGDKVVPPLRLAYFSFRSVWLYSYTTLTRSRMLVYDPWPFIDRHRQTPVPISPVVPI
ncbi:hypothetical protein Landi51_08381 [Colletotrichum acutatum]